ncbi:hypothetical protein RJG79_06405 [Mycoplasmatota bacterium WC44]
MKFMKKYFKYMIVVVIVLSIMIFTRSKPISMITFTHLYSQYLTGGEVVRIPILVNSDTYYTDGNSIVDIYIKDDVNKIPMKLDGIKKEDYSMYYNDVKYIVYMFDLIPEIKSNDYRINISNALLELSYLNDESVKVEFGDINLMYSESSDDLAIKALKPLINEINGYDTVVGFIIGIENLSDEVIDVREFNINSNPAFVNNELVKETDNYEIDILTDIKSIVPEYNYYSLSLEQNSFIINEKETKYFIVPITYERINFLYRFPIEINYNDKKYINDDFIFMNYGYFPDFVLNTKKQYEFEN